MNLFFGVVSIDWGGRRLAIGLRGPTLLVSPSRYLSCTRHSYLVSQSRRSNDGIVDDHGEENRMGKDLVAMRGIHDETGDFRFFGGVVSFLRLALVISNLEIGHIRMRSQVLCNYDYRHHQISINNPPCFL